MIRKVRLNELGITNGSQIDINLYVIASITYKSDDSDITLFSLIEDTIIHEVLHKLGFDEHELIDKIWLAMKEKKG